MTLIPSKFLIEYLDSILSLIYSTFSYIWHPPTMLHARSSHTNNNKEVSLLRFEQLKYWKIFSYPTFLPTLTHAIFTTLFSQHIVQGTALKQLFWLLDLYLAFSTIDHYPCTLPPFFGFTDTVLQWFASYLTGRTQYIFLLIIVLLLDIQVFLRFQLLALCFSPCILSPYLPLLINYVSHTIHLQMTCNYRYLLLLAKYQSYFTLCSHVYVMSMLGQQRTCLNLMTIRQNSCMSPTKELSISIAYLLQSLLTMLKFPSNSLQRIWVLH